MSSVWPGTTRFRGHADWNRGRRSHRATLLMDRLRLLVLVMRDVRTRIDGFVRVEHVTDAVSTSAYPLRQRQVVFGMTCVVRMVVSTSSIDRFLLGDGIKLSGCV